MIRRAAPAVLIGLLAAAAAPVPEPSGYRMEEYRAPTPPTLRGATVLTTEQAHAVWEQHSATFIDVLPQPPRPANLPATTIWRPKPRYDMPGSVWLPDTGYGALAPVMEAYFRQELEKATSGDKSRPIVFYCLRDCWMSWNAAKRAFSFGYTHVAWYPDGTDGWDEAGFPLEPRQPEPRPNVSE